MIVWHAAARIAAALLAWIAICGPADRAGADLLRCVGPDGRTTFTDDPATCPDAKPFEPQGEIQTIPSDSTPGPAARSPRRRAEPDPSEGDAQHWRAKKLEAESTLEALVLREEQLGRYITWCNRGRRLYQTDENGLKSRVACKDVREEYATIQTRRDALKAYLAGGLQEECRRAGCLPGWIR